MIATNSMGQTYITFFISQFITVQSGDKCRWTRSTGWTMLFWRSERFQYFFFAAQGEERVAGGGGIIGSGQERMCETTANAAYRRIQMSHVPKHMRISLYVQCFARRSRQGGGKGQGQGQEGTGQYLNTTNGEEIQIYSYR